MKKLFVFCASLMMIFSAHAQCQLEVFDSMLFIGKPDMTQYGLTPIKLRTYAAILSRSRAGNGVWGFLRMRWRLN